MMYYFGQPVRFVENHLVDINLLTGISCKDGSYFGYRTEYSDVEEIVDRKHWQPSSVEVSRVGKHPGMTRLMYDSPDIIKSAEVSSVNASLRHPSNDIVDTTRQLAQLKKITVEVATADIKAQLEKEESERKGLDKNSVPNNPSTPPDSTLGG